MRTLCREHIVVGEGIERVNFNKMVSMNNTAAYVWEELCGKGDFTADTVKELLLAKYDVEPDVAEKDAASLVEAWKNAGLLED